MIPHPDPAHPTRTAWCPPGSAYAAWVYLTCEGEDLTTTQIRETPLMDGITGVLFTTNPETVNAGSEDPL